MKINNSFNGFTASGYAAGFWASNALADIFNSVSGFYLLDNGQYNLVGRSSTCDYCCDHESDCDRCPGSHRELLHMTMPRGIVISESNPH